MSGIRNWVSMSRHRIMVVLFIALPIMLQLACDSGCIEALLAPAAPCHSEDAGSSGAQDECQALMTYRHAVTGLDLVAMDIEQGSVVSEPARSERSSLRVRRIVPVVPESPHLNLRI